MNSLLLDTADRLFQERGYEAVSLADVAAETHVEMAAVQQLYPDKQDILLALLERYSPRQALHQIFRQAKDKDVESLVRDTFMRLMTLLDSHPHFMTYAMLDVQVNEGSYLTGLMTEMAGDAVRFLNRLSGLPGMRPISPVLLGRAFAALVIGFVATQQFAPRPARFAMRIFPEKAWVDGMIDIFLYGILETE
ncbi:MAG: TetR/AcrR family transcriptional regulator; helix-turn-helix transcriptional regulator [Anaerolineae bacterium]|jgi:AcrR family transcriptional regulator|nr:TetR/AcrR family transcriptional regulator; helix-turn-helix transcriptional regulator [Anaerolineae bacterium]